VRVRDEVPPKRANDEAFVSLFREEYPAVARLAYLMLGDRTTAEDVAQEAFVRLYAHWKKVSAFDRPGAWVRRVAIRLASRVRVRRQMEARVGSAAQDVAGHGPSDFDLHRAVLKLPAAQRAAVVLFYFEDRPVSEVASLLGCAGATARVHLHRARRRLQRTLSEAGYVTG
jgi:RNA polymerase sigma factor (sigma-70 family)